ncbi:MAG: DUF1059 domain-containing protein [Acidimicrobiales bacterium]
MTIGTTRPRCDCGYECRGATDDELVDDAQRHAREIHGIEVTPEQVWAAANAGPTERGATETLPP